MTLLEEIRKRRKEAREMGRLIHPTPLISEFRKKKRVKAKMLLLRRAGDFTEEVATILRDSTTWASGVASIIVSRTLNIITSL